MAASAVPLRRLQLHRGQDLPQSRRGLPRLLHQLLEFSTKLRDLVRSLRAVPTCSDFSPTRREHQAKHPHHNPSWKKFEQPGGLRHNAASHGSKHRQRLAKGIGQQTQIILRSSQRVRIAAMLQDQYPERSDSGRMRGQPVGHPGFHPRLQSGRAQDFHQAFQSGGTLAIRLGERSPSRLAANCADQPPSRLPPAKANPTITRSAPSASDHSSGPRTVFTRKTTHADRFCARTGSNSCNWFLRTATRM